MASANPYQTPGAAVGDASGEVQQVKLLSVSGRIGRARYIAYGLLIYIALSGLGAMATAMLGQVGAFVMIAAWVAIVVIGFMLTIQRCHDFNVTGWLALLVVVPLANLIFWIIPGTDGENRWGAPTPPNGIGVLIGAWLIPVVAVIGVLAAVMLPAYQDYQKRAVQMQKK